MMSWKTQKALALLVHTIRDDWHQDGILTAIAAVHDQGPPDEVSRWAIRAALNPSNRTPAIIALPGQHRDVEREPLATRQPFQRERTCDICGKHETWCRRATQPDDHTFVSIPQARNTTAQPRLQDHT